MKVLNYICVWSKAIYGKCTYDWNTSSLSPSRLVPRLLSAHDSCVKMLS